MSAPPAGRSHQPAWVAAAPTRAAEGLRAHGLRVRRDLACLNLPAPNWPAAVPGPDGAIALDVLVIGAGMLGIAAAGALSLRGVRNLHVVDRAPAGREGPWTTYARMETLRSPKTLTGPAFGLPALTFRAWYEAREGLSGWETLGKIPNAVWAEYLTWLRRVLALPVENEVAVESVEPAGKFLAVRLAGREGRGTRYARHVVFATGRGGTGGPHWPEQVDRSLRPELAAHSSEPIDFAALRGKTVVVIGGGASAWDNAATALEEGAARVDMHVRRAVLPQVNKSRGTAHPGFFLGWDALDDAQRWALTVYLEDEQAPPPHETVHRTLRHDGFHIHLGSALHAARRQGDRVQLVTGPDRSGSKADFLILGTGFRIDLSDTPELATLAPQAATWGDRYEPPPGLRRPALERHPYLGPGFELLEQEPGSCPALARVHLFNFAAHASHRQLSSDVPGVDHGAEKLALAIAKALFREDLAHHRREVEAFAEPELEGTPFLARPEW